MSLSRRNRTSKKLSVGESGVDEMGVGEILGLEPFRLLLGPPGFNWCFSFASDFQWCCLTSQGPPVAGQHVASFESSSLNLYGTFRDLFVLP